MVSEQHPIWPWSCQVTVWLTKATQRMWNLHFCLSPILNGLVYQSLCDPPPFKKKKKNSYSLWQELACSPSEFWPTVPGRAEDGSKTIFVIASHNLLFFSVLHAYPLYGCGCRVTYSSTPNSALPLISETESDHVVSTLVPSYASHSPLWAFWVPGGLLVNLSPLISKWICRRISWSAKAESKGC